MFTDPRLTDLTFLRLMALRRQKRLAQRQIVRLVVPGVLDPDGWQAQAHAFFAHRQSKDEAPRP